ncbi:MAG: lysylphosphatidylglycerol synthase transmembrane domain-containing protein [Acidobacteriota bacterium]
MSRRVTYVLLAIGISVLVLMVMHLGFATIAENVEKVSWRFLPIVAVWGIVYACNAWAIYLLIDHQRESVSFRAVLQATISSFAINYITPFLNLGGEPYRAAVLKPYIGGRRAVSAVVSYNIVRMMGHCLFWLFTGVVAIVALPMSAAGLWSMIGVLAVVLALFLLLAALQRHGFLESAWGRLRILFGRGARSRWFEAKALALGEVDERLRSVYAENPSGFAKAIAIETVSRLIATWEFVFIMEAVYGAPSYRDALMLNGASSLVLNIFFFIPFELGAREGSLYMTLHLIGYTADLGIFVGLINRARELVWIAIGLALMPLGPGQLDRWKRISLSQVEDNA